jgi:L-lactate dehydrogenase complex protein LldE
VNVALFATCVVDTLYPSAGEATASLLESLGHRVCFPPAQTCCGQMHANSGYEREALTLARRLLAAFQDYDCEAIVAPSGSCVAMVRHHYPRLAAAAGERGLEEVLRRLGNRVFELSEFLVRRLGVADVGAYYPHRVVYHPSCHGLRALGLRDEPLTLLRAVRGLELAELPEAASCCGFGGVFAVKLSEISAAMMAEKIRCVLDSGAEVLTALDCSCLMHIGGGLARQRTGVRVVHLAEILASREPPRAGATAGERR